MLCAEVETTQAAIDAALSTSKSHYLKPTRLSSEIAAPTSLNVENVRSFADAGY